MVTAKQIPALKARTPEAAYEWWLTMTRLGWNIHPDDDPFNIGNSVNGQWVRLFDDAAARRINVIRDQLFQIPGDRYMPSLNAHKQVTQLEPALERLKLLQRDKQFYIHVLGEDEQEMVEVSGGAIVIAFDHESITIIDPRISECGRFTAGPGYYGLTPEAFMVLVEANEYDGGPSADIPAWPEITESPAEQHEGEYEVTLNWRVRVTQKVTVKAESLAEAQQLGRQMAEDLSSRKVITQLADWDIDDHEQNVRYLEAYPKSN